jgi:alkylation response protein AidB-like acyl-CoA dehydrogenase
MVLVQLKLLGRTIELYGSEEQKNEYLPKIRDFKLIGGWGLTEKLNGSDASALTTNVKKVGDNFILNGNKRWIGNANKVQICFFPKLLGYYGRLR